MINEERRERGEERSESCPVYSRHAKMKQTHGRVAEGLQKDKSFAGARFIGNLLKYSKLWFVEGYWKDRES